MSFKVKVDDYCVYRYQVGSSNINKPLLCKVTRANPAFEVNPIIIKSVLTDEEFQIDKNYKEFPFEPQIVLYTIPEAKEAKLWKPIFDIALERIKKNQSLNDLMIDAVRI